MERPWCSRHGECLRIAVHVQPNASRTEISGLVEGAPKISLHAPAVDGKANEELTTVIAARLKLAKTAITGLRSTRHHAEKSKGSNRRNH